MGMTTKSKKTAELTLKLEHSFLLFRVDMLTLSFGL